MDGTTTVSPSYANSDIEREKIGDTDADTRPRTKESGDIEVDSVYKSKEQETSGEEPSSTSDSEDEQEYPEPFALAMITIALCLVVFLVALVSRLWVDGSVDETDGHLGQYNHCDGYPGNHKSV